MTEKEHKESLSSSALIGYTLQLADNALVLGHRCSEWTGHGPILEEDIALSNISLDLIGQARNFYQYAARLSGDLRPEYLQMFFPNKPLEHETITEDVLAYFRDSAQFRNGLLVELPNGDWGRTVLRVFLISCFNYYLYQQLEQSRDKTLSAIAEKAIKESTYHLRWSSEWVIRLGDGTQESHNRMQGALEYLWPYTGELFQEAPSETEGVRLGYFADLSLIRPLWDEKLRTVFAEATLARPTGNWSHTGGKAGKHTEHLSYLLTEMQFLQRAYPGNAW